MAGSILGLVAAPPINVTGANPANTIENQTLDYLTRGTQPNFSNPTSVQQPSPNRLATAPPAAPAPDYSAQLGSIDAQSGSLRDILAGLDTQLNQGQTNINDQYNQQASAANLQRSRALEDFQNTEQGTNLQKQQALDQVNTKARTLANSVRQMIGNAAGSGSSAYQITAPGAVARQANLQNQDITNTYGQNFDLLNTAKNRADQDFTTLFDNLGQTKNKAIESLKSGVLGQRNQINGSLADLAAQRAAYTGGNPTAAMQPFQADIAGTRNQINGLFDQYRTPFNSVTPVSVAKPTLRDYVTGQTQVAVDPNTGSRQSQGAAYNPLATWLKQDNQQNSLFA